MKKIFTVILLSILFAISAYSIENLPKGTFTQENIKKQADNGNLEAQILLGRLLAESKEYEQAEKYYKLVLETDKDNDSIKLKLAEVYINQQKYYTAEEYLLPLTAKDNITALKLLSAIYVEQNLFAKAEPYLIKLVEKNVPDSTLILTKIYFDQGKYDEAKKYLLPFFEKNPENVDPNIHLLLGTVFLRERNFEEGKKYLTKPADAGLGAAQLGLGLIYFEEKNPERARHYLQLASAQGHSQANQLLQMIESGFLNTLNTPENQSPTESKSQ
ncbi:tetratricopeptide repeat protein [Fusobacterium sp. PH5-44]|uniref:tetratricopeptide repeat protein n=1 Tax=unclassified Fusobacterium TaxID=2648384 RepID=UPI003D23E925